LDRRVGQRYLAPGLGFGGPCFPRDNVAFRAFARGLGLDVPIPEAVHCSNGRQPARVVEKVMATLPRGGRVAVLGLAYKPHTAVVDESQALAITAALAGKKMFDVAAYDPMAMDNARVVLGHGVRYAPSVAECLRGADLCILATPWPEFGRLSAATFKRMMRRTRVLDCWRCLSSGTVAGLSSYAAVGMGDRER
jgi:UDPglucose 6-dehydrogenase